MASIPFGAAGAVLTVANVVPKLCVALYEEGVNREIERAISLQDRLMKAFKIFHASGALTAGSAIGGG